MIKEFPYDCTRCGFCCISENCQISQKIYNIPKRGVLCPCLSFNGDTASCKFAESISQKLREEMGFSSGCCISARIISNGETIDFAGVSRETKIRIVKNIMERTYVIV